MTRDVTVKVGAWLNSQCLLGVVIGVTASLGLWVLGVPYFYVLGLIAAVGEFVPIIGPILAAIPSVLLGFSVSVHTGIFVIVYFSVQQFIEGNILVPRLMQRQVGVSAWSVIVALLIGSELLGVVGAILAVPSRQSCRCFCRSIWKGRRKPRTQPESYTHLYAPRSWRSCRPNSRPFDSRAMRSLRILDDRQQATAHVERADRRQSVFEQLSGTDDAPEARGARDSRHSGARGRHRIGADDRRYDGDPHGAGTPARGVQED